MEDLNKIQKKLDWAESRLSGVESDMERAREAIEKCQGIMESMGGENITDEQFKKRVLNADQWRCELSQFLKRIWDEFQFSKDRKITLTIWDDGRLVRDLLDGLE